ncbi:glycerophosphodiester phosphodiesterase [Phytoactinopolyspora alkaliphila]|uniref:Glycerophosphodiester phosphodiesterase n=1 Tax=Phytoactinopolyspora alkaliphila TaxID=1783498 RepID=A0A6N9YSR1_9ACTN|nr:glycerophosphodiester phosphodiesterase family protein [Phytoactinopolyspora alkaliphila]NED98014.1 glycerophosphodiester phosphodiesterase [Phytoactinopolyspora alkaliphila]
MNFINCGHRGAMSTAPENTLSSFAAAVEQGANEIELDLRLSKDGTIVVIHDATVDRTTDGSGAVSTLTLDELRTFDAGDSERIPTFDEVLDATDVALQIEIKDPAVIEPLSALLADRADHLDRLSPTSFDEDVVGDVARRLPSTLVGLISKTASYELLDRAEALGARRVLVGWEGTDRPLVRTAQDRGFHVNVWPVNSAEQLRTAAELGVDGFTTDYPGLLFEHGYDLRDGRLVSR